MLRLGQNFATRGSANPVADSSMLLQEDVAPPWGAAPREVLQLIFERLPLRDRCPGTDKQSASVWRVAALQAPQCCLPPPAGAPENPSRKRRRGPPRADGAAAACVPCPTAAVPAH